MSAVTTPIFESSSNSLSDSVIHGTEYYCGSISRLHTLQSCQLHLSVHFGIAERMMPEKIQIDRKTYFVKMTGQAGAGHNKVWRTGKGWHGAWFAGRCRTGQDRAGFTCRFLGADMANKV